ncbi:hypothetical protein D3C80_2070030 [compost metagenome]
MYVRILSVDRGHIKLEVACVHNGAFRCIENNTKAIRNTVVGSEKAHFSAAKVKNGLRIYAVQTGLAEQPMFFKLAFN